MAYFNRTNNNTNFNSSIKSNDKVVINSSKITNINNISNNINNTEKENVSLDDLFKDYNKETSNNVFNNYNSKAQFDFDIKKINNDENIQNTEPKPQDIINLVKDPNNHVSIDIEDLGNYQVEASEIMEFSDNKMEFIGKDGITYNLEKVDGKWKLKSMINSDGEIFDATNPNFQKIIDLLKNDNLKIDSIIFSPGSPGASGDVIINTEIGMLFFNFDCSELKYIINANEDYFSNQSIFNEWNALTSQYGGDQNALNMNLEQFLNDPKIRQIIEEYFPGQEITDEDLSLLFYRMNKIGCGYVAAINTIFEGYKDLSNEEWEELFGFPRVAVDNLGYSVNYDYLFLEFFIYYNQINRGLYTIEELYGNAEEERNRVQSGDAALTGNTFKRTGAIGTYTDEIVNTVCKFLNEKHNTGHDVDGVYKSFGPDEEFPVDTIKNILSSQNNQIIIGAEHFNLYSTEDLDGNGLLDDKTSEDVGAHGMTVTGVTDDGRLIVSSWGDEFILDPNEKIGNNSNPIFSMGIIEYPIDFSSNKTTETIVFY